MLVLPLLGFDVGRRSSLQLAAIGPIRQLDGHTYDCFAPIVDTGSAAWARPSANGQTFDGRIVVRTATYIAVAKVAGIPSIAAVKKALASAGEILLKP